MSDYLIKAYRNFSNHDYKLVIAGGVDHNTSYARSIRKMAQENDVLLTGFVTGEDLNQLYTHARLFVLPSYNEGFPLAVLEAMSYDLPVIVSDIPANLEIGLPPDSYFPVGNEEKLIEKIEELVDKPAKRKYQLDNYCWENIAKQTIKVYEKAMMKKIQ